MALGLVLVSAGVATADDEGMDLPEGEVAAEEIPYFGRQRVRLSLAKPNFSSNLRFYNKLYGSTPVVPSFGADYQLTRDRIAFGGAIRIGYFQATGHAAEKLSVDNPTEAELSLDDDESFLTIIPYRFLATMSIAPMDRPFVFFDFWAGYEELFYQEVRGGGDEGKVEGAGGSTVVNTGWNGALVVGAAINVQLNRFDPRSVRSLRRTTGLGRIYFSPFVEVTMQLGTSKLLLAQKDNSSVNFARQNYGAAFVFEQF